MADSLCLVVTKFLLTSESNIKLGRPKNRDLQTLGRKGMYMWQWHLSYCCIVFFVAYRETVAMRHIARVFRTMLIRGSLGRDC